LLYGVDRGRCGGFRFDLPFGREDVLDHFLLKGEYVLVADVACFVRLTGDQLSDLVPIFLDLVSAGVDVSPEMPPPLANRSRGLEVKEHAVARLAPQARMNTVGKLADGLSAVAIEHFLQVLE